MWQTNKNFLLQLLILILAPAIAGAEMVSGTVLSVDREQGTIVLRTDSQKELQVHTEISSLPRHMMPGKLIRVWGEYESDGKNFSATDIRGPGKKIHHDLTGVRARIGNGKYCRKSLNKKTDNNNGHDQDVGQGSGNGRGKKAGGSN